MMAGKSEFMRYASPNEQRTISREDVGFYHAVIVGAVYDFDSSFDASLPGSFFGPLQQCIKEHPFLYVIAKDTHTNKSFYERVPVINLGDHIFITEQVPASDDMDRIEGVLASNLDKPFPSGIPPWRIVVAPLHRGCFMAFAYSHAIGDGKSGAAFHRTFLNNMCSTTSGSARATTQVVKTPVRPLPAPFDTPDRLPISWSFLLLPLLSVLLPPFVLRLLGLPTVHTPTNESTWTGSEIRFDAKGPNSNIVCREIEAPLLRNALRAAKERDAKLTGLLQQIILRALSVALPDPSVTNFVSETAVNMRGSIGTSDNEMGIFVSGIYMLHPRVNPDGPLSDVSWDAARDATRDLARCAVTLQDQAIGLLRYAPSIRKWILNKIGQRRDASFEVSNIGTFDGRGVTAQAEEGRARITKMIFAQPGFVIDVPLAFQFVSVVGGDLVYTITWRAGSLGIPQADERKFVEGISSLIRQDFEAL